MPQGDAPLLRHPRYEPGEILGRGAQGTALRVTDRERPERALVAKVWRPGAFDEDALAGEFALLARLRIPGIVRAHDLGHDTATGAPFLVEDFVGGPDARAHVGQSGPRLSALLAEVALTLAALNDAGFVHNDVKPAHVRCALATGSATLLDLGAAVPLARRGGAAAALTPAFAAPEALAGAPPSPESEAYALGALGWSLAAGAPPRPDATNLAARAPWVPPRVAEVIERLVRLHPRDRPSLAEVVAAIGGDTAGPRRPAAVIGRERELSALLAFVDGAPPASAPAGTGVLYVTGPSGAGKSELAREAVTRALLRGCAARIVGFPGADPALVAALVRALRGEDEAWPFLDAPRLVVLDDLHAAPSELLAALDVHRCRRATSPRLRFVATAREAPDGAEALPLGPLKDTAFAELCRSLGIGDASAAARSSGKNPGWLVAERARVPLTRDTALARIGALDGPARRLLAHVALVGGAVPAAFVARAGGGPLRALLEASLLDRRARGTSAHYTLSAPSLAAGIAEAIADADAVRGAAEALLALDAPEPRALLTLADGPAASGLALAELRAALRQRAAARARADGLRAEELAALHALCVAPEGRSHARLRRLEHLARDAGVALHPKALEWLSDAAKDDPTMRPLALRRWAERAARDGDARAAQSLAAEAREAAGAVGTPEEEALARATSGAVALWRGDWAAADDALTDAHRRLAALREAGASIDVEELARLTHNVGVVALYRGRLREAADAFERSLDTKRRLGDRAGMRACLLNLGIARARAGEHEASARALDEALLLARSLGQTAGRAWCLAAQADLEVRRGSAASAARLIAEAEALGDAAPAAVRADLVLLRAELTALAGDGARAAQLVAELPRELREADEPLDLRARLLEARAHLARLPAAPREAARQAIAVARRARASGLLEQSAQALSVLAAARARGARPGSPPEGYASGVPSQGEEDVGLLAWLDAVASAAAREDAALALARWMVQESGAERAFVLALEAGAGVTAWGCDLEGLPIPEAERRIDALGAARLPEAGPPLYERAAATAGGTGSRLVARRHEAAIVLEHRFHAGRFDGVSEGRARLWATAARALLRVGRATAGEHEAGASDASPGEAPLPAPTTAVPRREARRTFPSIRGTSEALRKALARLDAAIDVELPVLLVGETGVGKELFARALHEHGARAKAPFVAINCGAIADSLFESELFGHARGAFTGADRGRPGLLARAEGGTLLLDEIGELPLPRQAALLRALESRRYRPVGSDDERSFDVRLVAATNRDLGAAAESGEFRRDLLFRLNVVEITVPPLRERRDDIAPLMRAFLDAAGATSPLSRRAVAALTAYEWPGNVRELQHLAQRLASLRLPTIDVEHLPRALRARSVATAEGDAGDTPTDPRAEVERALLATGGNISRAAQRLGLTRHGLKKRMVRLGLRTRGES